MGELVAFHLNCDRESHSPEPQLPKGSFCAPFLTDPLPVSICPIKATEARTRLLLSCFHSAGDPHSLPLEGMMDCLKQNHLLRKLKGSFLRLGTT